MSGFLKVSFFGSRWCLLTMVLLVFQYDSVLSKITRGSSNSKVTEVQLLNRAGTEAQQNLKIFLPRGGGGKKSIKGTQEPFTPIDQVEGEMPIFTAVFNMIVDLCPSGIMPLAYGLAAGGGTGIGTAITLLVFFGSLAGYTMVSLGRVCETTKQISLSGVWANVIGQKTAWVPDVAVSLLTFGCCVFFSAFMGDIFAALAEALGVSGAVLKSTMNNFGLRTSTILMLTVFPVLPLCLLKDLSALQYTSFGGLVAILYTAFFVALRFFDGSYQDGGKFFSMMETALQPIESTGSLFKVGPGSLIFLNIVCVGFLVHYNSLNYYTGLQKRSVATMKKVVSLGMGTAFLVFLVMMTFGFRTFGLSAQPLLLNNYHKTADVPASWARLAVGVSILCGYPLMFMACKTSLHSSIETCASNLQLKPHVKDTLSISVLLIITAIACNCGQDDVGFVIGIVGSLLGAFACYIMPSLLNIKLFNADKLDLSGKELLFNKVLLALGVMFAIFGTAVTCLERFTDILG
mmetsp:Transcript_12519/g.16435  ORF Transcript_12519/g.16435 Transcript_12519/m.16435 type:complete len:517 (+) Transcript_12519:20-1570(+)